MMGGFGGMLNGSGLEYSGIHGGLMRREEVGRVGGFMGRDFRGRVDGFNPAFFAS